MQQLISDIAFTPTVKAVQGRLGSRSMYAKVAQRGDWSDVITPDLAAFIAERDTLFLGTVNADGQPYIQHRGGPPGFLKVLDDKTLAFADFTGNLQYISMGNLEDNDKAFIFLIDFANRRRVKIWGHARFVGDDPELIERLHDAGYDGEPERALVFRITAWDRNCPQHIVRRFTEAEVGELVQPLQARIRELEERLERAPDSRS